MYITYNTIGVNCKTYINQNNIYQVILNHEYKYSINLYIYNFQAFVLILYIQHMYITFKEYKDQCKLENIYKSK